MKALNTKTGNFVSSTVVPYDIEDRHPCWYANLDKSGDIDVWVVGRKHEGQKNEFVFELADVEDLPHSTSKEFGIKLIDIFREGGSKSVKKWISNGCPL